VPLLEVEVDLIIVLITTRVIGNTMLELEPVRRVMFFIPIIGMKAKQRERTFSLDVLANVDGKYTEIVHPLILVGVHSVWVHEQ
jgi:hypothetical protein